MVADRNRDDADAVSERPLWVIGLMFACHIAWVACCALWIPSAFGVAISARFGSPVFVVPVIIFVYAIAPLVASFSKLGREYWDLVGRAGTARQAAVTLLILGTVLLLIAVAVRQLAF